MPSFLSECRIDALGHRCCRCCEVLVEVMRQPWTLWNSGLSSARSAMIRIWCSPRSYHLARHLSGLRGRDSVNLAYMYRRQPPRNCLRALRFITFGTPVSVDMSVIALSYFGLGINKMTRSAVIVYLSEIIRDAALPRLSAQPRRQGRDWIRWCAWRSLASTLTLLPPRVALPAQSGCTTYGWCCPLSSASSKRHCSNG